MIVLEIKWSGTVIVCETLLHYFDWKQEEGMSEWKLYIAHCIEMTETFHTEKRIYSEPVRVSVPLLEYAKVFMKDTKRRFG